MNERGKSWLRHYAPVGLVYLLATYCTDAPFMGDTADYIHSLVNGVEFWEFGHLGWRPLGWLLFQGLHTPVSWLVGDDLSAQSAAVFIAMTWVSGLASVLLLHALCRRYAKANWLASLVTVAFIFSQAFLNFTQTGSSYIPGLCFLLTGFFLLLKRAETSDQSWSAAALAGGALALAIGLWFPYVWAMPAVLLAPFLIGKVSPSTWPLIRRTMFAVSLFTTGAYLLVILHLGISDWAGLRDWITAASHGMNLMGMPRTVLGLARSFIHLGNDSIAFKRFSLHDPYAPTAAVDLLRAGVWKLLFFYLTFAALLISLARFGKRFLLLLGINALPLFGFALFFDGGSAERYLPLYPTLFLAAAYGLAQPATPRLVRWALLFFFLTFAIANVRVMNVATLTTQQAAVQARLERLHSQLTPQCRLFVISEQDEMLKFNRTYFFNPMNQQIGVITRPVVLLNTQQVDTWMTDFAAEVDIAWKGGGDAWLSKRLFSALPSPQWNWVEGEDRRIGWRDLHDFFVQLETAEGSGDQDGFVRLLPTANNQRVVFGNLLASQNRRPGTE
ncbi:MAG: hypothetical protein HY231_22040 [Acidobacteria bacterium]|nr:hypothetical protein [Acidobacteriota bacterium]